jgi:hypothetical protein
LDHDRARKDCKRSQTPTNRQPSSNTPGEHFAKVREIDGVADVRSNARCDQALFRVLRLNLGQAVQLVLAEVNP